MAAVLAVSVAAGLYGEARDRSDERDEAGVIRAGARPPTACSVPLPILTRLARGYHPERSGDVLLVEQRYSQIGRTRHSSPYPEHQNVPLVLYGPGHVEQGAAISRPVTLADIAPTIAELMRYDGFEGKGGKLLTEAVADDAGSPPRLVVTVVWDGGGDNVLDQWSGHWPNLERLVKGGTSYENATVGSTPSITPAVHATIGTGSFPSHHGITDTHIRVNGKLVDPWEGDFPLESGAEMTPSYLEAPTLADLWDLDQGNAAQVGLVAWDSWHMGMLGHGASYEDADADIAAIHRRHAADFISNPDYYSLPAYVSETSALERAAEVVDDDDGERDGEWLGKPLDPTSEEIGFTPAWPMFQTHQIETVLTREGFGRDAVTDLFFTNYKSADMEAHRSSYKSDEVRSLIEEQDRSLGEIVETAKRLAGERGYVIVVTADHGMTAYPEDAGRWSFDLEEVAADVETSLDKVTPDRSLISRTRGFSLFLNPDELRRNGLTISDVARFLRNYSLRESATNGNPVTARFEEVADEPLFLLSVPGAELFDALRCARRRT